MPTPPSIPENFENVFLKTPVELASLLGSHGVRPFGYLAQFSADPDPTQFGSDTAVWESRLINLDELQDGYGAEEYCCRFTMWDPASVEAPNISLADKLNKMKQPKNGDLIRVWQYDTSMNQTGEGTTPSTGRIVFQGAIRQVHDRKTDTGVTWAVEATSDVSRLNDPRITLTCNFRNDPINPSPHFDGIGTLVLGKLKTLAEIIKLVMQFKDAWSSKEFFTYDDIDWVASNGDNFETSSKCGGFVPSQVSFQDTPKGQAIQELLQRAGNYTFHFNPATRKLQIVELNLACNHCGTKWPINFVSTDTTSVQYGQNYAFKFSIKEDNTDWNSKQTANVCRITSGAIRFYSGHSIVAEYKCSDPTDPLVDFVDDGTDIKEMQMKRSKSLDNIWYRFSYPSHLAVDKRKQKRYYVGAPLFPDWNVHEDYLPAFLEIQDVALPPDVTSIKDKDNVQWNAAKFRGQLEWQSWTVGDSVIRGVSHLGHLNNLRMYQAWHAPEDCPACSGSGLVLAVYSGANNEPEIAFEQVGTTGNPRYLPRVTNYIFDPAKFGSIDPLTSKMYEPTGLSPWTDDGAYPLPWKNLCPYCRGVGKKPEWKIRNIQQDLFAGRNNQIKQTDIQVQEYPIDPDATATGPETWEEAQSRMLNRSGAFVQVESPIYASYLPDSHANSDISFDNLYDDIPRPNDNPPHSGHRASMPKEFPHQLKFTNLRRRLAGIFNVSSTDPTSKIVPDDWTCNVPFTTVTAMTAESPCQINYTLGTVRFDYPLFIPCRKPYSNFPRVGSEKLTVTSNGTLRTLDATNRKWMADSNERPTGYWRPARVWMTFYYTRENYYLPLANDLDGNEIKPVEVTATSADGETFTYLCRAMISDGQWAMEVRKKNPSTNAIFTEFDTGNRVMPITLSDPNAWVETSESDLYKMVVPPTPDVTAADLETYKRNTAKFDFPRGKLLKMDQTTPGEERWEMEGYVAEDYFLSRFRPKVYTWRMRDDRPRLLSQAIRQLEVSNKLQVTGTLFLVGTSHDVSKGLGFVDYPERGFVAVKRISYKYDNGFCTELELSREEARAGEIVPKMQDQQNAISKEMTELRKFIMTGSAAEGGNGPMGLKSVSPGGRIAPGVGRHEVNHEPKIFYYGG